MEWHATEQRPAVSGGVAAVDGERGAGDEPGLVAGEVGDHAGDLVGRAEAADGGERPRWSANGPPSAGFMSVSTAPQFRTFTVMPRSPSSRAKPFVRPSRADLLMV